MASGRNDESQVSSDEEQEVFAGYTVEEISDIQQARQTRQEQNLLRNVDDEIEDFSDLPPQERGSNSDVELYASEEEEEGDEESATKENRPNALQWSSTLREIDVRQFIMAQPEILEIMQLLKISSIYFLTMATLTKLSASPLGMLVRKGIARSQQLERKFQRILG